MCIQFEILYAGSTPNSLLMRSAYQELIDRGFDRILPVRGDNYCGIRAVTHQLLCHHPSHLNEINLLLPQMLQKHRVSHWDTLRRWSFAERLKPANKSDAAVNALLQECVTVFVDTNRGFVAIASHRERLAKAEEFFASSKELMYLEAVKLLMFCLRL